MERFGLQSVPVLDQAALERGIDEAAERLCARLDGHEVTVVSILGGSVFFMADLVRRLPLGPHLDFMRIQTYGDSMAPECAPVADWLPKEETIRGKHVLLVDDIFDTGRTLQEARRVLEEEMGAQQVTTCVLINKPIRRQVDMEPDEFVKRIDEDLFLVGYGMDYRGQFRNLPELRALTATPDEAAALRRALRSDEAPNRTEAAS